MPELRKDPVTGRWVIIAAERSNRPQHQRSGAGFAESGPCPFCAGNEAMTPPEILAYRADSSQADQPGWRVRVVPNKYPALVNDGGYGNLDDDGLYASSVGLGVHEVIIECPRHVERISALTERDIEAVLLAYRDRMRDLRADRRWRHILVYKNQGAEAGATLPHVHSQLIALPEIPKAAAEEIAGAKNFHDANGLCIYCELIRRERAERARVIAEDKRFTVISAYAPRFPFELWILPKKHGSAFEENSAEAYAGLARVLRETLTRLDRALDDPPFNYIVHSHPAGREFYHWHLKILPRLTQPAGFEWGSGSFINPVAPEEAARLLRGAL